MQRDISSPHKKIGTGLCTIILTVMLNLSIIPQSSPRLTGDLWLTGVVTLNGTSVTSGITVFSDSRVRTTRNSSATVNLGKLGRIKLEPESEMVLQFSNGLLGGSQMSGLSAVSANRGIKSKITTPHVVVEFDGSDVSLVSLDVKPEYTCVVVNRGNARLTAGQKTSQLGQGQALSFNARGPEKNGHCEGLRASRLGLPLVGGGAGVTAAALIPLTRGALATVQGTSAVSPGIGGGEASNQSSPPPSATATNLPTTPFKPPTVFQVCGCKYDKDGKPLSATFRAALCRFNTDSRRYEMLSVDCNGLLTYYNLNGSARPGHDYTCGACP